MDHRPFRVRWLLATGLALLGACASEDPTPGADGGTAGSPDAEISGARMAMASATCRAGDDGTATATVRVDVQLEVDERVYLADRWEEAGDAAAATTTGCDAWGLELGAGYPDASFCVRAGDAPATAQIEYLLAALPDPADVGAYKIEFFGAIVGAADAGEVAIGDAPAIESFETQVRCKPSGGGH
jgi:hypothetical protein